MSIINAIASVAVRDLSAATKWYEAVLRKAPSKPMPEVAEWGFDRGGWLQVYQLPERAGSGSFTLAVSNLEEEAARLKKLNIDTSHRTSTEKVKTLMIKDPDWQFDRARRGHGSKFGSFDQQANYGLNVAR